MNETQYYTDTFLVILWTYSSMHMHTNETLDQVQMFVQLYSCINFDYNRMQN